MKLTFLGSGAAFCVGGNWQSNMMITNDKGKHLFIDCGGDLRHALHEQRMSYKDITDVYISHLHGDHIGGLECLALCSYFDPSVKERPRLYINRALKNKLWNSLAGGLETLQGKEADLETYFDVIHPSNRGTFIWEGNLIQTVQTVHIMNAFSIVPSYGLLIEGDKKRIFITTDSQFCPEQIKDFYAMADEIFQDCETLPWKSGVHANFIDLKTLPEEVKRKMWLYHCQDGQKPKASDDGFLGIVNKGDVFEF